MLTSSAGRVLAFILFTGLAVPLAGRAEIISVPPADPPDPAASVRPVPICPPGYTVTPDYGCVAPSGNDYTEGAPGYDYWPDYGWGYPFGGFPGFGFGANGVHRFAGFHGGHGLHRKAGFHSAARFAPHAAGMGHIGGFGRR